MAHRAFLPHLRTNPSTFHAKVGQVWERLLFASRGALALQKCFYHLVQWKWTPHGFPILSSTTDTTNTPIQMTAGRSTTLTTIPRIESSMGKRTLGVCLAPDGSFTQEFEHRHKQALTWVQNIGTSPLTREEVYTAYCSMWRPSFEFPLPITCFSKEQCHLLQKAFTGPFLSKMGLSSKTNRKLIFAPYHYSGFAIADTWVQQGLQHLQLLLGHLCQQDQMGNLRSVNIETLEILLGHPQLPLSYSYKDIRHIASPSWLTIT